MKQIRTIVCAVLLAAPAAAQDNSLQESAGWTAMKEDVVGPGEIGDGAGLFEVEAPYRANDAATVPIHILQTDPSAEIDGAVVVIDENPAPVAADFTFGEAMGPIDFELRVRVNQYSNVRVIAETPKGMRMAGRFVKASGGCSAPATRDPEQALANMGEMRLRQFPRDAVPEMNTPRREAQIMIRHPNYSGLQRDQVTQLFITAHFIDTLEVRQGDELLFSMTGGISISENPVFRFAYDDDGSTDLTVRATDTEGNAFEHRLEKTVSG
jgi:sulfur-oxidizing protein SoxY